MIDTIKISFELAFSEEEFNNIEMVARSKDIFVFELFRQVFKQICEEGREKFEKEQKNDKSFDASTTLLEGNGNLKNIEPNPNISVE